MSTCGIRQERPHRDHVPDSVRLLPGGRRRGGCERLGPHRLRSSGMPDSRGAGALDGMTGSRGTFRVRWFGWRGVRRTCGGQWGNSSRLPERTASSWSAALAWGWLRPLEGSVEDHREAVSQLQHWMPGNVVVARAPLALRTPTFVWGPRRPLRILQALKVELDPVGILGAGRGPS